MSFYYFPLGALAHLALERSDGYARGVNPAVACLFFLSGWTGLVYEVLWAKYLALTLGSTAAAHTFVLSAFLGGMAIGYASIGRIADRHPNPLRLYAGLELAIAALGAVAPLFLGGRWGLALIPLSAALMGGTLPALSRVAPVPLLYFLNSVGAAWGSLCAGFLLIPRFGLDASGWITALVNAAVAAAAWRLGSGPAPHPRPPWPEPALPPRRIFYAAAAASGFVSLALEIAWIRLLALMFGSTVYSFAVMLAAFIAGVGGGSLAAGSKRVERLPSLRTLIAVQLIAALALMLTLPFYERIAFLPIWLDARVGSRSGLFMVFETVKFALSFLLMFVPAACFGMVPPLAAKAAVRDPGETGARVGAVFAWNAVGNVAGAVCAGLWLLPALGLQGLFNLSAASLAAIGAGLTLADASLPRRRAAAAGVAACAALFLILCPVWRPGQISFGGFRKKLPPGVDYAAYREILSRFELLYHKDGREATVSIVRYGDDHIALKVNGKTDASNARDLRTEVLASQLPLLLHGTAKDVLVIGLGSGVTVGGALTHPVDKVTLVEISPEVVEAERWFRETNRNALADPRVETVVEDARSFLLRGDARYDVIVSEPSNPWMAGIGALFTAEYYARARERLKPGGVMAQWFHFYEMNASTLKLVLRTFSSEFPDASLWITFTGDILILGSNSPLDADPRTLPERMARPAVAADLARIGIRRPTTLLALQIGGPGSARRIAGNGRLNRDRFPRLEYAAPLSFFLRRRTNLLFQEDEAADPGRRDALLLRRWLKRRARPLDPDEFAAIDAYHGNYRYRFRSELASEWIAAFPKDPRAYLAAARAADDALETPAARAFVARGLEAAPRDPALLDKAAFYAETAFFQDGKRDAAAEALALLERLPPSVDSRLRAAKLFRELGEFDRALERLRAAGRLADGNKAPNADEVWMEVAALALEREKGPLVVDALEHALKANPDNRDAKDLFKTLMDHFRE